MTFFVQMDTGSFSSIIWFPEYIYSPGTQFTVKNSPGFSAANIAINRNLFEPLCPCSPSPTTWTNAFRLWVGHAQVRTWSRKIICVSFPKINVKVLGEENFESWLWYDLTILLAILKPHKCINCLLMFFL